MIDIATEIGKRILIWGVLAIVVVPRQHVDRDAFSIGGGNLSHSFRKILSASVGLNFLRLMAKLHGNVRLIADVLGVLQAVSLSFVCFLTPYVLQTTLVGRINIGRPGANLLPALYATGVLSTLGVILCRAIHPNLWFLKRLGSVISGLPVLQTLAQYNTVTSVGGHHHGRGTIMGQTMVVVEYWHIITQLLCVVGLAFDKHIDETDYNQWDYCLKAFRDIAFISDWTRVCFHGIFINLLDEMYLISPSSPSSASPHGGSTHNNSRASSVEEKGLIVVTTGAGSPRHV